MLKIKDNTLSKWEKLGFKEDNSQYYDVSYYKDLYCNYNEANPNLCYGTLFTDGKQLYFHKGGNFTNQFINKNNFMQKLVDKEIKQLEQAGLVEKEDIMKELLEEIEKGIEFRKNRKPTSSFEYQGKITYYTQDTQGKGSKAYIIKRIDLLREKLLEVKKELK